MCFHSNCKPLLKSDLEGRNFGVLPFFAENQQIVYFGLHIYCSPLKKEEKISKLYFLLYCKFCNLIIMILIIIIIDVLTYILCQFFWSRCSKNFSLLII